MNIPQEETITSAHHYIWNRLRSAKDGERVLGADLRAGAGGLDTRTFYQVIEDLRTAGIFVGASKHIPRGYYEIRTTTEMNHFLRFKRRELLGELNALAELESKWLNRKKGGN